MPAKKISAVLVVLIVVFVWLESLLVSKIRENSAVLEAEKNDLAAVMSAVRNTSETEKLCSSISSDKTYKLPEAYDDANKFYSAILKELSNYQFTDTVVLKGDKNVFVISGTGDYWQFVQFVASFRSGNMLCRVSSVSMTGGTDNSVSFKITAEAEVKGEE